MSDAHLTGRDAALELAVRANDRNGIADAIRQGANPNALGRLGVTPLMLAVDKGYAAAVVELLAHRADPNAKAADGASPMSLAVESYKRHPDILLALLNGGGNPNIQRPDGEPVIIRFVNDRDCNYLRMMKEFGADIDAQDRSKDPLVIHAALADDWDAVLCLIKLGAKIDYEQTRYPLSKLIASKYPGPGSPMFPFKKQVWEHLKSKGIAVAPLE